MTKQELTEYDKALLEQSSKEMDERNRKFFEAHGVYPAQAMAGKLAYKAFLEEHRAVEAKLGKSFFHSPLAMKAFVVGYFYGKCR